MLSPMLAPAVVMYLTLIPCAGIFMYFRYKKQLLPEAIFKGISLWIIIGGALFAAKEIQLSMFSLLIIAGLAMGLAGDVALALPNPGFTSGMAFFGLGHICYISALILISNNIMYSIPVFIVLYAAFILFYRKTGMKPRENLKIPILIYSMIIAFMLSLTMIMPLSTFPEGFILMFAGILFVSSDILLLYNGFPNAGTLSGKPTAIDSQGIISTSCYFLGQSFFAISIYFF